MECQAQFDETSELLELGKVLYAYKKIPKCNKYNTTKYELELLKQKLLEKCKNLIPNSFLLLWLKNLIESEPKAPLRTLS